jgi:NAD(P)-dependent dehydrogenase (short-subunit alcohol dehydrogenase family)
VSASVVVVIGVGGMGEAIARRQGPGHKVVLADFNEQTLESLASSLAADGYDVTAHRVDVGSPDSVGALARSAASAGAVTQVIHTAGLSPTQAEVEAILRVDLYGVALVLDVFGEVVAPEGAGVVISSMSGQLIGELPPGHQKDFATASTDRLLSLPYLQPSELTHPGYAYAIAKSANRLRVMSESVRWGRRGARVNSISPGVISTPQGRQELDGKSGQSMLAWIEASGSQRIGTPFDIANAVAFLLSRESSFITGTDLLVDGGVVAAVKTGALSR